MKKLFAPLLVCVAFLGALAFACGRSVSLAPPPDASSQEEPSHKFGFGPNPSPLCVVSDNGGAYAAASPNGINVTGGDSISIQLASYAGVRSWQLTVYGLDELSTAPALSYSVGPPGTYSFTFAPFAGRAVILQSVVNGGVNINGVRVPSYTTTIGIFTLTASGQRVLATGETFETCQAGWICDWNAQTRAINNGLYGGLYTSTDAASVSLTSLGTFYQVTYDTTFSTSKNTSTSGNGTKVLIAVPVLVSSYFTFFTSAPATVTFEIYKNGVLVPGAVGSVSSTSTTYASASLQTLVSASVNDVFTTWASANVNTIALTYDSSLTVTGTGALQGVAGPPGPPGTSGSIGGGACGGNVSGTISLTSPAVVQCFSVDLTSVDATVNVSTITPFDGLAYQFDLQAGTKSINFTGGTFVSIANGSTTPLSSMSVQGGGQSVVIKYNAANSWWTTP